MALHIIFINGYIIIIYYNIVALTHRYSFSKNKKIIYTYHENILISLSPFLRLFYFSYISTTYTYIYIHTFFTHFVYL